MSNLWSGVIDTQNEYIKFSEISGVTFEEGKTYIIQINGSCTLIESSVLPTDGGFLVNTLIPVAYTKGAGDLYVKGESYFCTLNLAEGVSSGGGSANIESLSITPSTSAQTITASGGVDGYSPVNVSAVTASIDANIVAGNIKSGVEILGVSGNVVELNGETKTIIPRTYGQTIYPTAPKNGITQIEVSAVTASIDANITAGNIKKDVQILGVTGTLEAGVGEKYGANTNTFLGDVDANGVLQLPTEQSDLVFTGVKDVVNYGLYSKFTSTKVKTVSFPNLTTISGLYGCYGMLDDCTALTSVSLPNLTTISGNYGCRYMFHNCTALTSVSFPALTTIIGSYGCQSMLQGCTALTSISFLALTTISGSYGCQNMLYNCTALTSVSFPALTTISGSYGCQNMLQGCTALTSVSFPALTTISGAYGCQYMFYGCTALTDVYFPALTTTSFGSNVNQFSSIMNSTGTGVIHTLHFPSNLESTIQGLIGYPLFGGTSGYVVLAFDLPATE